MNGFTLTPEELLALKVAHRAAKKSLASAAYKINAVILLGTGWTLIQVKEALLLDEETLRSYVQRYQDSGVLGLIQTHHVGAAPWLTDEQRLRLQQELERTIYLTTTAVIEYVSRVFGVQYSVSGMRDLLHRTGYVYKKPTRVPGNPDPEAQEVFVEQFEAFMQEKPHDVEVLFVDAVHPEHNAMAAYGWMKKGQERLLKTNSGRERLNLHGALNAETYEVTVLESKTVNADSTIQLIDTLDRHYHQASKIVCLVDQAGYHHSKRVKDCLKEYPRIQFVFLPVYSPELNLIERLWKFFKKKVLYNQYYKNLKEFRKAAIYFFRNIDDYSSEIASIMGGGFHIRDT